MDPVMFYLFGQRDAGGGGDPDPEPGDMTLSASTGSGNLEIDLSWTNEPGAADTVRILRSSTSGGTKSQIDTVSGGVGSYTDTSITAPGTFYYEVEALDSGVVLVGSNSSSASAEVAENFAITLSQGADDSGEITVDTGSPVEPAGTDHFDLYRREKSVGGAFSTVATTINVPYVDTVPSLDTLYEYFAEAYDASDLVLGKSAVVEEQAPSSAPPIVPNAPTNLQSTDVAATTTDLSWDAATVPSGGGAVTGYKVYRDGSLFATLGNVTTYQATGLSEATTSTWTVTAVNADGESDPSSGVLVTTLLLAPSGLSGQQIGGTGSSGFVRLTWTNNSSSADNNVVKRDGVVYATVSAATAQYDVPNDDATADFTIVATASGVPDSEPSNTASPPWPE